MKSILAVLAIFCLVGSVEANVPRGRAVIRQRTVIRGGGARFGSSFRSNVSFNSGFARQRFFSSSFAVGNVGYSYAPQVVVQPAFVQSAVYVPQVVVQPAVVQQTVTQEVIQPQVSYLSSVQVVQPAVQLQTLAIPAVTSYATGCGVGSVSGAVIRSRFSIR